MVKRLTLETCAHRHKVTTSRKEKIRRRSSLGSFRLISASSASLPFPLAALVPFEDRKICCVVQVERKRKNKIVQEPLVKRCFVIGKIEKEKRSNEN